MDKRAIELIQESNDRKLKFKETLYIVKQPRVVGVVVGFMITIMVSWMVEYRHSMYDTCNAIDFD